MSLFRVYTSGFIVTLLMSAIGAVHARREHQPELDAPPIHMGAMVLANAFLWPVTIGILFVTAVIDLFRGKEEDPPASM